MPHPENTCKSWNAYYDHELKKIMIPVSTYDVMSSSVIMTGHSFPIESAKAVLDNLQFAIKQAEKDLFTPVQK
jgi:hypothetical protein